jgi:hypothetical protein
MRHVLAAPFGALALGLSLLACPGPPAQRSANAPVWRGDGGQSSPDPLAEPARADAGTAPTVDVPPAWCGGVMRRGECVTPRPPGSDGVCAPTDENLARAARDILSPEERREAPTPRRPWDHKTTPEHMKRVADRMSLTRDERALLAKNGFVVIPGMPAHGYARAYHDIYQSQLPLYVTADSVFHAMFKTHERLVRDLEVELASREARALASMHKALAAYARELPPEVADDVDLYVSVARALLADEEPHPTRANAAEVKSLVDRAKAATAGLTTLTLFGRPRVVDFSQYRPRGHYAESEELSQYFRASMWLSRLELNLVSRASRSSQPGITPNPEPTPREAVTALAIAELASRAGTLDDWDALERAWSEIAGRREDVSPRALLSLRAKMPPGPLTLASSAPALERAVGAGYARTTRVHYMPQGSTPLPVIFTMLGPRIVSDTTAATHLVHSDVAGRATPGVADVAWMLGHDHAKGYLERELTRFPALATKLADGRRTIAAAPSTDMYGAWLGAIRALAAPPAGVLPSFVGTSAYADMRMSSIAAAYGQLRHANMLFAGQGYMEGGCEVPDGFVEPAPHVWAALRKLAVVGGNAMHALGSPEGAARYAQIDGVLAVLETIARDEVEGRALSEAQRRFLSMVVEIVPPSSDSPGRYDGWYFQMFATVDGAFDEHAFVADWFTGSDDDVAVYAGASTPRYALFVVDTGGAPRVMVGPVARGFEVRAPLSKRLSDEDAQKLTSVHEPWASSYTAPPGAAPALQVLPGPVDDDTVGVTVGLRSTRWLGAVTVELLDHHRERLGVTTVTVGRGTAVARVRAKPGSTPEVVRVVRGEFRHEQAFWDMSGRAFGGMPEVTWEETDAFGAQVRQKAERGTSPAPRGTTAPPPPATRSTIAPVRGTSAPPVSAPPRR